MNSVEAFINSGPAAQSKKSEEVFDSLRQKRHKEE